jgi:hypothetical protein
MRVCYLIQTHKEPIQVCRLVSRIKKVSFHCFILISHDYSSCDFPSSLLDSFSNVALIPKTARGFRSDFSLVQAYLDSISWLLENEINFDWLVNLSGQDYPIKSPRELEEMLAHRKDDGLTEYFEVLSSESPWGKQGKERYYYQYWRSSFQPHLWQKLILKPIEILINKLQPWVRMNLAYGLSIGIKAKKTPFHQNFRCYGGSFFHVFSYRSIMYLHHHAQKNPSLISYYRRTLNPDESYITTVLINANELNICNYQWMYVDFSQTKLGHPQTFSKKDYPKLIKAEGYFARKFDEKSEIFDLLDHHIFKDN